MLNTCMVVCLGGHYCIRLWPYPQGLPMLWVFCISVKLNSTYHEKNKNKTKQLRIQELETFHGFIV